MRNTAARIAAIAALVLYLAAPLMPALPGSACQCTGNGEMKCGRGGFVCHCCATPAYECDKVSFSACKEGASKDGRTQPPAIAVPESHTVFAFYGEREIFSYKDHPVEGYRPQPLKPPSFNLA